MQKTRSQPFERSDIWREGKWLDLWSVVHFLTGISIGLGFRFLPFGGLASIVIVLISLIAYEMWEALVKIEETPMNRFMDVVVGMASFLPTYFLGGPMLQSMQLILAFGFTLTANIVLSVLGWRESQKAIELEGRMRARYESERLRLREERTRLRRRFRRRKARSGALAPVNPIAD